MADTRRASDADATDIEGSDVKDLAIVTRVMAVPPSQLLTRKEITSRVVVSPSWAGVKFKESTDPSKLSTFCKVACWLDGVMESTFHA